jgi:inorganic pyrophosphatase/exopolyphosphatase
MALKSFLKRLSTITASESKLFVIGNSSADYDSIFGSIIFSFLLTSSTGQLHVPLIDCKRSELRLRFDVF